MAVFRVEKTRNYTVMSNYHLRDKSLSLKAKGLLSLMLSLPEDWDYTTKGLARICKDGVDSICATVRELEGAGYIVRARERHADGTLGGIEYTILEQPREPEPPKRENPVQAESAGDAPKRAFPEQVKPVLGKPEQENPVQLNIEEQSKEELSTDVMDSFPSFPHESKATQENGMERRETYRAQIMAHHQGIVVIHGQRRVIQRGQQILLHMAHLCGVLVDPIQHIQQVRASQLQQP